MTATARNFYQIKRKTISFLAAAFAFGITNASAELIVYEGFDYERRQWTESGFEAEGIDGLNGGFGWPCSWEETATPLNGIAAEARDVTGRPHESPLLHRQPRQQVADETGTGPIDQ